MGVFEANAAELERLHDEVKHAYLLRSQSAAHMLAWEKACRAFHTSYDALAFPGGLAREFSLLAAGDETAIEMAVRFLEANPRYFRSGYHKEDILRLLRKAPLADGQLSRLRELVLERIRGRPVREVRAFCRLAPKIANKEFAEELVRIASTGNRVAVRQAQWAIQCIKSSQSW
jgi:hypothetical protein